MITASYSNMTYQHFIIYLYYAHEPVHLNIWYSQNTHRNKRKWNTISFCHVWITLGEWYAKFSFAMRNTWQKFYFSSFFLFSFTSIRSSEIRRRPLWHVAFDAWITKNLKYHSSFWVWSVNDERMLWINGRFKYFNESPMYEVIYREAMNNFVWINYSWKW